MREILFRGKRLDNGEWAYGDLLHLPHGLVILANGYANIDPSTVGQYTGLQDKNGKRIFEGDIVRHYNHSDAPELYSIGRIFWDEKHCKFRRTSNTYGEIVNVADYCIYEVIGNVADNPELLGGSNG